jgi:hypothetical protein
MTMPHKRWFVCAGAAALSAIFVSAAWCDGLSAGGQNRQNARPVLVAEAHAKRSSGKSDTKPQSPASSASTQQQPPPRTPFTAAEDAVATIPGIPDARFWADSETDFQNALPKEPGPWLTLSSGGEDGAFGAGVLVGLSAAGKRPDFKVVTGVSSGALMAPFAFAGSRYDEALKKAYTTVTAADIFEAGGSTGESFVLSWPLRDFIAKQMTPELMADIATAYRAGRRLFVLTTNLDAERFVVWNMGAIAAHGGEDARKLFVQVLLASASVPGGFPPVLIDVESGGKRFAEMHVDGGLGGQFFVAPHAFLATTSHYRLPASALYVVVNTGLERDFQVVDRFAPSILTQAVGAAVKVDTRLMLTLSYALAKRSGVPFNVASIPPSFVAPSQGAFDPKYMGALFQVGYEQGKSENAFSSEPPPYPNDASKPPSSQIEKTGAN